MLVFANKQDLPNAMSVAEIQKKLRLEKLTVNWHIQGCVATTGDGLYDGLDWIATRKKHR